MTPVSAREVKELLRRHGVIAKKGYGQNFLVDGRVLEIIVRAVAPDAHTVVLEVGPGLGALTSALAERAKRVVAIEKDASLRPVLDEVLSRHGNVEIVYEDCLKVDLRALMAPRMAQGERLVFAANLPYYVTTPILFQVLESELPVSRAVVMVQREVADRMVAEPGGKDYGVLSVGVQYRGRVRRVANVPPSAFLPQPGVESAVVEIDCEMRPAVRAADEAVLFRVVRAAFGTRRKTLENALAAGLGEPKEAVRHKVTAAGIDPGTRAERLSLADFVRLADEFAQ
ncbi:16S rRNA (adenine(1518)-N(6)/adenine(1519)-N(6))-dimethyltransferase RsmA [Alicyclobacillus sendaiensis]|uniref:Ribosomal RNA small subunit methyltransferase A n=1 Tax=Alicyclobacillus sendaiensis PA2 TaxID=3029425 RepID=A0ABT6XZ82_ALISE|nr:16S rRNA (adenine(1518)-N(6)/adenine(1519)-N(6))-dimethyltransferase RsmA [Alicyclobacillus sendaiensis]MDI9260395.1 16S rRNA (adenine(1518)-N(6)/adenine(1519)-N(6))-dimethyltransferase RsmA [Alicyclobacillus sendaiensis PA2]